MRKTPGRRLARFRVPLSWGLGLLALYLARPTPVSYIVGVVLAAFGESLRVWASGHLVKGEGITRSGPYSWTRNPLYLGSTLMGLGLAVASNRWELLVLLVGLLLGIFLPVIKAEADHLARRCPELYRDYAEAVPLFIPGLRSAAKWRREKRFSWEKLRANREHVTVAGCAGVAVLLGLKLALTG